MPPANKRGAAVTRFQILGDVQMWVNDKTVYLPLKQRTVLAALLMDANRLVPTNSLIDRVWDDTPPQEARNVLYSYLTRIRRVLADTRKNGVQAVTLLRQSGGYSLEVDRDRVDAHRLWNLAEQARALAPQDPRRLALLREAVALWGGEPLAGLPGEWVSRIQEGLRQRLLGVLAEWADCELQGGESKRVIDLLSQVVDGYPITEPLIARLIRALYHDGRKAEALAQYAHSRAHIAAQLGVEPGVELRELYNTMLCDPIIGSPEGCGPSPGRTCPAMTPPRTR